MLYKNEFLLIVTSCPGSCLGFVCSCSSGLIISSGMCCIKVPLYKTLINCSPPHIPNTGLFNFKILLVNCSSKSVLFFYILTVLCLNLAPKILGSISKFPPVITNPSINSL